jgi:hypothetical protein
MWAVSIYAFRRGGWEEKVAAAGILVVSYGAPLSLWATGTLDTRFQHFEALVALIDGSLALLLLGVALRSPKFWPLWLTAMEMLTVLSHFALYVPHMLPWSYWNAAVLWSYPMLMVLAFGVRGHHRQVQIGVRRSNA